MYMEFFAQKRIVHVCMFIYVCVCVYVRVRVCVCVVVSVHGEVSM